MRKTKEQVTNILGIVIIVIGVWVSATNIVQGFKCTKMTHTELFLRIPQSIMLNWGNCANY